MADPFFYFGQDAAAVDDDEDYLMSLGQILPPPAPALPGSAFEAYRRRRAPGLLLDSPMVGRGHQPSSNSGAGSGGNVHRRMLGYLGRIVRHDATAAGTAAPRNEEAATVPSSSPQALRSSRFRHIMRERVRRERLSQGFADLHALLPPGASSKGGKNDIVGAAASYIRELEGRRGWLRARNQELLLDRAASASSRWRGGGARNAASAAAGGDDMVVKVRAESGEHATAVDVFEAVLRRLKAMEELRVTAIRSCFCAGGMWMDVGVESHQVSTDEVDKAITNALVELAGNELGKYDPSSGKPSFSCQVESGVRMG